MAELVHELSKKDLAQLEKQITKVYSDASKDMEEIISKHWDNMANVEAKMQKQLDAGKITQADMDKWRLSYIGRGNNYESLRDSLAERATHANEVAIAYVNDKTPTFYSIGRNATAYSIEHNINILGDDDVFSGVDFQLMPDDAVRRLLIENPDLMPSYPPEKALARGIDLKYGKEQINKTVTGAILQGQSIGKIADTLQDRLIDMNRTSALRTARTAAMSALNAGTNDTIIRAKEMGLEIKKQWMTHMDIRTRPEHAKANMQIVDVDEPFVVGGEKIDHPQDPHGSGWNIYNCRCTERAYNPKFPYKGETVISYKEWERIKYGNKDKASQPSPTSNTTNTAINATKQAQNSVDLSALRSELEQIRKSISSKQSDLRMAIYHGDSTLATKIQTEIDALMDQRINKGKILIENLNKTYQLSTNNRDFVSLILELDADNTIDYVEVLKHKTKKTYADIVSAIAGGDMTQGSCASVGLAYIGQMCGLDVLDFRDGASRKYFAGKINKVKMFNALGVQSIVEDTARSNLTNAKNILARFDLNKEYYLSAGCHAALVRAIEDDVVDPITGVVVKTVRKYQYLELQSAYSNGWQDFEKDVRITLKDRFGCIAQNGYNEVRATEISQLQNSDEFRTVLGYINTNINDQKKGSSGRIR